MSNMKKRNKLNLTRETLRTLVDGDLGGVQGGTSPSVIITATIRVCRHTDKIAKSAIAASAAGKDRWTKPSAGTCGEATGS